MTPAPNPQANTDLLLQIIGRSEVEKELLRQHIVKQNQEIEELRKKDEMHDKQPEPGEPGPEG